MLLWVRLHMFSINKFYFLNKFEVHSKIKQKVQIFPITSCANTCTTSAALYIPRQSGAFVTTSTTIYISHQSGAVFVTAPPTINIPKESGAFVTISEQALTHHYHLKSKVYFRFSFDVVPSIGFDKCIKTWIHHCSIVHNSFTALKPLVLSLVILHPDSQSRYIKDTLTTCSSLPVLSSLCDVCAASPAWTYFFSPAPLFLPG